MTPEQLDELERLEKEATPGPWEYFANGTLSGQYSDLACGLLDEEGILIAAMRNALPELIRLARIGQAVEGTTQKKIEFLSTPPDDSGV
jgi:hypothetical protein